MNAETVVSILFSSNSNSDWNGSEEEEKSYLEDDSLHVDRLSMEQCKMTYTRGVLTLLYVIVRQQ